MKVVLATGIYPPEIGGIATYAERLAKELGDLGHEVRVIAYEKRAALDSPLTAHRSSPLILILTLIPRSGGPLLRWWRYAQALKTHAADADIVYALSTVSTGIPVWLAGLKKPKKILRLGGDFLWERYTDRGGRQTLRAYYENSSPLRYCGKQCIQRILNAFDAVIFSTDFQKNIYEKTYALRRHAVLENALNVDASSVTHSPHTPFRLLTFSRFVGFKNLGALIQAMTQLPDCTLTLAGEGPLENPLRQQVSALCLHDRVTFRDTVHGADKLTLFAEHDLLVVPSLTDISPNAALEARANGLPVLLTEETGLSDTLTSGMQKARLLTSQDIAKAVQEARNRYASLAQSSANALDARSWQAVAKEHVTLFADALNPNPNT